LTHGQTLTEINRLTLYSIKKDQENRRIQLLVVAFHKLKQNWKSDDDDDAVLKLYITAHTVHTVEIMLYKYKSRWHYHITNS